MPRIFEGMCSEDREAVEAFVRGRIILDHPVTLKIAMGSKCNQACTFCKSRQRDWKQEESVFADLAVRFAPKIRRLTLTGGEPLLYWKHFNNKMRQNNVDLSGIIISMITNGALLEDLADDLRNCRGLELFISFNAATRETYQRVHGADDFEKVIRGIRAIQRVRSDRPTKIRMKMVYMRSTFREIKTYVELAKDLQVDEVVFAHMTFFRQAEAPPTEALQLDDPEWPEVEQLLADASAELTKHGIAFIARRPGERRLDPQDVLNVTG
ncbi:MAG: radical SAM protein [Phycisphaerales bacterium]|nr:MAG: radical SAM protein [Phycisphaerales bacterium]